MSRIWTNEVLDEARGQGDPIADPVVAELFRDGDIAAVNQLMRTLVVDDGLPSERLPAVVRDYLARTALPPDIESAQMELAQEVFGVVGPEILAVLGFYSLPADYAAKKGVQVLYRTGRLITNPTRRVFETTQMVVDVMAPGVAQETDCAAPAYPRIETLRVTRHAPPPFVSTRSSTRPITGSMTGEIRLVACRWRRREGMPWVIVASAIGCASERNGAEAPVREVVQATPPASVDSVWRPRACRHDSVA